MLASSDDAAFIAEVQARCPIGDGEEGGDGRLVSRFHEDTPNPQVAGTGDDTQIGWRHGKGLFAQASYDSGGVRFWLTKPH